MDITKRKAVGFAKKLIKRFEMEYCNMMARRDAMIMGGVSKKVIIHSNKCLTSLDEGMKALEYLINNQKK